MRGREGRIEAHIGSSIATCNFGTSTPPPPAGPFPFTLPFTSLREGGGVKHGRCGREGEGGEGMDGWADNVGVSGKTKQSVCLFGLHHHLSFGERSQIFSQWVYIIMATDSPPWPNLSSLFRRIRGLILQPVNNCTNEQTLSLLRGRVETVRSVYMDLNLLWCARLKVQCQRPLDCCETSLSRDAARSNAMRNILLLNPIPAPHAFALHDVFRFRSRR